MKKTRNIIKINLKNQLIKNFTYLSIVQLLNILLPLILIPYLLRILKSYNYGLIVYAQSIIAYIVILVNFGFDFSATKNISKNSNNKAKINEITSSVIIIKLLFFGISIIILFGIFFVVSIRKEMILLLLFSMHMVLMDIIIPIWFFQGIEKMKPISISILITKLVYVVLVFLFIKKEEDFLLVPVLNLVGVFIGGTYSLYLIFAKYSVKLYLPKKNIIIFYIKDSFALFLSRISSQVYVYASKFLIGTFIGLNELAYYDIAEKVVRVIKLPQYILSQVLFPRFSKKIDKHIYKRMQLISLLFVILAIIAIYNFAPFIITLINNESNELATRILRILIFSVFPVYIVSYYATLLLIPLGFEKIWTKISIYSVLLYLTLFLLLYIFKLVNVINLTFLNVIIEFYVLFTSFYQCKKLKILL